MVVRRGRQQVHELRVAPDEREQLSLEGRMVGAIADPDSVDPVAVGLEHLIGAERGYSVPAQGRKCFVVAPRITGRYTEPNSCLPTRALQLNFVASFRGFWARYAPVLVLAARRHLRHLISQLATNDA